VFRDGGRQQKTNLYGLSIGRWHWLNCKDCMPMKEEEKGLINVDLIAGTNDSAGNMYASCVMDWTCACTDRN
jgi:hypothetical protein